MRTRVVIPFALLTLCSLPARAESPVINLSISGKISPDVYGQIQLGNASPPPVIYAKPMIIDRQPNVAPQPIYLHVPSGHERHWAKHCHEYHACNRPVYFVRSSRDQREYERRRHDEHRDEDRGHDRGRDRGHGDNGRHGDNDKRGRDRRDD